MKAIIVDSSIDVIDSEMRTEMLEWAHSLGIDTKGATATFALTASVGGGFSAHFSMKRQRDGHDYVLPGTNRVATDYNAVVVPIADSSWPMWFGEAVDLPEMSITTLLEALAVAAESAGNLRSAAWYRRHPVGVNE